MTISETLTWSLQSQAVSLETYCTIVGMSIVDCSIQMEPHLVRGTE